MAVHEAVEEKEMVTEKGSADKNFPVEPSELLLLTVGTESEVELGGEYEEMKGEAGREGGWDRGGEEGKNGGGGREGDGGEGDGGVGEGDGGG